MTAGPVVTTETVSTETEAAPKGPFPADVGSPRSGFTEAAPKGPFPADVCVPRSGFTFVTIETEEAPEEGGAREWWGETDTRKGKLIRQGKGDPWETKNERSGRREEP